MPIYLIEWHQQYDVSCQQSLSMQVLTKNAAFSFAYQPTKSSINNLPASNKI